MIVFLREACLLFEKIRIIKFLYYFFKTMYFINY